MLVRRAALAAALLAFAPGCIDTDAAVFVEAKIIDPAATIEMATLTSGLNGSFTVNFHLGPRANGSADVTLTSFSLADGAGNSIVPVLGVATTPNFPVTVPIDGDVPVNGAMATDENLLDATEVDAVCAGDVVITGVFDDSLRGGSINVSSEPFSVSGCP